MAVDYGDEGKTTVGHIASALGKGLKLAATVAAADKIGSGLKKGKSDTDDGFTIETGHGGMKRNKHGKCKG